MNFLLDLLNWLYALVTIWLAVYGLNSLILAVVYLAKGRRSVPEPDVRAEDLPAVTVQLPLYNERHVAERLIDVVAGLEYPRAKLQIQILDDSTDETAALTAARVAVWKSRGLDIEFLHRHEREGFKAGALAQAMPKAKGEFIAIFDADFCPHPDFLLRTVPHLLQDDRLGMVQARWAHLNTDYSILTRVQALALDGHFVIEQVARGSSSLLMHFNGTAGVWRRSCIEDSGGWQSDTLCEDLDLSYRAQVRGWRFSYLTHVEGPAELPPQILAFKQQQRRWAQGAVQCLRKLAGSLLRSQRLSITQKLMGLVHLSGYLAYPLMVLALLLSPVLMLRPDGALDPLRFLAPVCLGPIMVYVLSQWAVYGDWKRRLLNLPLMVLVGTGVGWSNSMGAWRGLVSWGGEMLRTPKFRIEGARGDWSVSRYRMTEDRAVVGEVLLALYATGAAATAAALGHYGQIPFLLLCAASFGLVAVLGLVEALRGRRAAAVQKITS